MATRRSYETPRQSSSRHDSFSYYDPSSPWKPPVGQAPGPPRLNIPHYASSSKPAARPSSSHSHSYTERSLHPDTIRADNERRRHHHHHHHHSHHHGHRSKSAGPSRRRHSWPPQPTVEDEVTSLAKEANPPKSLDAVGKDEVLSRGTVDQEPLIQDVPELQPQASKRSGVVSDSEADTKSTPRSGIPTPPTSEDEKARRGRRKPSRPPLNTGSFAPELEKRTASPYSFTKPTSLQRNGSSSDQLLSPDAAAAPTTFGRPGRVAAGQPPYTPRKETGQRSPSSKLANDYFSADLSNTEPSSRDSLNVSSRNNSGSSTQSHSQRASPNPSPRTSVVDFAPPAPANAPPPRKMHLDSRRHTDVANTLPKPRFDKMKRPTPLAMASGVDDLDGPAFYSVGTTPASEWSPARSRQASYEALPGVSQMNVSGQNPTSPNRSPRLGIDTYQDGSTVSAASSRPQSREGSWTPLSANGMSRLPQTDLDWTTLLAANAARRNKNPSRISSMRMEGMPEAPRANSQAGTYPPPRASSILPYPEDDGPPSVFMPSDEHYAYHPSKPTSLEAHAHHELRSGPYSVSAGASSASLAPQRPSLVTRHSMAGVSSAETRSPADGRYPPEKRTLTSEVQKEISSLFKKKGMPQCTRPTAVAGYDDWYTMIGAPSLDFCPDCIDDVFERSIYRPAFRRAPPRSLSTKVQCAFGSPWIRLAWLLTLERQRTDLMLLRDIAEVEDTSEPCPGAQEAARPWYSLRDHAGLYVPDFHVCYNDVQKIERLLPTLIGLFVRLPNRYSVDTRLCAMRGEANRFPTYMNSLIAMHEKAQETRKLPDQMPFIQLVEHKTQLRECSKDNMLVGEKWHFIPSVPTLTVCQDCYDSVVEPEVRRNKDLAMRFNTTAQLVPAEPALGTSCQLYSRRMRKIFKRSLDENSLRYLARKSKERRDAELRLQDNLKDVMRRAKRLSGAREEVEEERKLNRELEFISSEWKEKFE